MKNINKSKFINFIVILAAICLLIFFSRQGLLAGPKNMVYWAVSPFIKLFQVVDEGASGAWSFFVTLKDLNRENTDLKNINQALLAEVTNLKEATRENELLRQQLGVNQAEKRKLLLASITGYNLTLGQYIMIDKGLSDGVVLDSAVIVAGDILIGQVVEVNENFSKVLLIIDGGSSINAITQEARISGAVKGRHGLGMVMEMIPIDAQIKAGEAVLTAGLNIGIPKGLIIGKIMGIAKKESEIWQQAIISPAIDFSKLEEVFVLLP